VSDGSTSSYARAGLRVDVLGNPVVTVEGAPLAVDTRKAVALLAVLALSASAGQLSVARARLAALLWPEVDETRARATLRRTLSVLIAAAGPAVVADRASVSLRLDLVTSDVVSFRLLGVSEDRENLARAVGLVRGELLAGFVLRDSPTFDEWVSRESDTLRRELGTTLERLVLARLRHGELHAGVADAARWLELDPLHEAAHRSLMRLLAWTGRRQDALEQYQRCVRVLGQELGVAPVHTTTEMYEAIRSGTLPPPRRAPTRPPPRHSAPPSTSNAVEPLPLVGRDTALHTLQSVVGQGDKLVLVTGEAGAGRSRLVEEFAATAGPVVLVRAHGGEAGLSFAPVADLLRAAISLGAPLSDDLAGAVSRLVPEILPAGRAIEPPLSSPGARDLFYDAVVRVLAASGAAAVVLEDVHALGSSSAEVLAYLVHRLHRLPCPLILTLRDPGLAERHPLQVAITTGRRADQVTTITLSRFTRGEVALLCSQFGVESDLVWRDTAGLPLLVVAAVRSRSDDIPATVRDLLAARLAEVSGETAQVLAALAVLDGVADPGDLHHTSGRTEVETVEAVEEALHAGLVREEGSGIAFTHDILRRVVYDRLSLLRRRLLHRRAAETLAARRDPALRAGAIATHFRLGGCDDDAATWSWRAATRSRELFAHQEALHQLDVATSLGRDDAEVALARGDVLIALARYEPARDAFARALALSPSLSERASIERRLADIAARLGEWSRAAAGLDAALRLVRDNPVLRARLLADRAVVALRAGSLEEARVVAESALAAAPGPDAYVHNATGAIALSAGDLPAAIGRFKDALATLAATPDLVLEAAVVNNLATAQAAGGAHRDAAATAQKALELGTRLGDRHRLAALHANLADRLHELNDAEGAELALEHLKHSAALFAEVGTDPLDRPDVWTLTTW
jgi:DNA-binding SARP family transcriptional activator/tetratricopeptide (TPR) repeat protein